MCNYGKSVKYNVGNFHSDCVTGKMGKLVPTMNLILTMIAKQRNRNCKFLAAINSMQLYISGCSQNVSIGLYII